MKKLIIVLVALLAGISVMSYLYFSALNRENSANDLSLNVIATKSPIIFSFDNDKSFYEILAGQDLLGHLLGEEKYTQFKSLKENLAQQAGIAQLLNGQKIYIGMVAGKGNAIDFLISTQLKETTSLTQILGKDVGTKMTISPEKDAFKLSFSDSSQVYISIKDKLVLLSNNLETLQKTNQESQNTATGFTAYIKNNSRLLKSSLANVYINFKTLPLFLKNILNTNLNGELAIFNQQDAYAALSYNYSTEKLLFYGNTTFSNPKSYYKLFENFSDLPLSINTILPEKTANYTIYAVANYAEWYKGWHELLDLRKEVDKVDKNIAKVHQQYGLDLAQVLPKYFKNEFATYQLSTGEKFGAIALTNGEKVGQLLLDLSRDYAPEIKIFKEADLLYAYFGDPFKKFEKPFYTIKDNYLVIANHASSIQTFLNDYKNNSLLINNLAYQQLNSQLSAATISFYVGNKNSTTIFSRNLRNPYYKQYRSKTGFSDFSAFSYQLTGDKDKFLSNLLLYKQPVIKPDTLAN